MTRASLHGRLAAATIAAIAAACASASVARADGDPASDYLLVQKVFVPFDAKITAARAQQLTELVTRAKKAGYEIRVALIATRYELGSVTALWLKPRQYARFLAEEIKFLYSGPLLIVMPNGFGFNVPGRQPTKELATLGAVRVEPGSDGLTRSAITAVQKLAAADGVKVSVPPLGKAAHDDTTRDRIIILVAVVAAFALAAAARFALRKRRPTPQPPVRRRVKGP